MEEILAIPSVRYIKYTVVTVCYNAIETIEDTIRSVVEQTYEDIEYIIIDGGSTDGTCDIIKKYADRLTYWISESDNGIYDAMNKGIDVATGDYIIFMNSGDSFADKKVIEHISRHIEGNPTIIYGDWFERLNDSSVKKIPMPLSHLNKGMAFPHQAAFIKAEYHKCHPYNLRYRIAGDFDVIYSAFKNRAQFQYIPCTIAIYDITPTKSTSLRSIKTLIREHIDILGIRGLHGKVVYYKELAKFRIHQFIKSFLPERAVMSIKSFLDKRRHKSIPYSK